MFIELFELKNFSGLRTRIDTENVFVGKNNFAKSLIIKLILVKEKVQNLTDFGVPFVV